MNSAKDNTGQAAAPARNCSRPSDSEILDALETVDYKIYELRRAAMVTDEYVRMEISAGNDGKHKENCILNHEQVCGILYMLNHIRNLSTALEMATNKAYGREVA